MREILFAGFCPTLDDGVWIFGLPYASGDVIDKLRVDEDCGTFVTHTTYNIAPETLSEFTGLYDVNRVRIFENDIVKVCDNLGSLTGAVVWSDKHGAWMIGDTGIALGEFAEFEREVIGNVFREDATK